MGYFYLPRDTIVISIEAKLRKLRAFSDPMSCQENTVGEW